MYLTKVHVYYYPVPYPFLLGIARGMQMSRLLVAILLGVNLWKFYVWIPRTPSTSEEFRLHFLLGELSRLRVDILIAGLSKVRRPGSGDISVGGYTYYWSSMANGNRL